MVPLHSFVCSPVLIHPIFNEWLLCARPARPMERSFVFKKGIERGTSQQGHGSSLHLRLPGMHWSHFSHFNHRKAGLRLYLECIALWFSSFTHLFCQAGGERGRRGKAGIEKAKEENASTAEHTISPPLPSCLSGLGANSPFHTREVVYPWQLWLQVWMTWQTHKTLKAKTTPPTN